MKKLIFILSLIVLFAKTSLAEDFIYEGSIKKISDPINIKFKNFNGLIEGQNEILFSIDDSKGSQITKGSISTKKVNTSGDNLFVEYIITGPTNNYIGEKDTFKIIILITPEGKVIKYFLEIKDIWGEWQKIRKVEIKRSGDKKVIELLIDSITHDYSSSFSEGDIVVNYPYKDIVLNLFQASESDLQITKDFNYLDSVPVNIGGKLIGETCYDGRTSYLIKFDSKHKYKKALAESKFSMDGYQLIDKDTGFYFHGRIFVEWFIDFGEVLDNGSKTFDYYGWEKFDLSFKEKNCSTKTTTQTKTITKTKSNTSESVNKSVKEKLIELKNLFDQGLITKEVYEKKQLEILE